MGSCILKASIKAASGKETGTSVFATLSACLLMLGSRQLEIPWKFDGEVVEQKKRKVMASVQEL